MGSRNLRVSFFFFFIKVVLFVDYVRPCNGIYHVFVI